MKTKTNGVLKIEKGIPIPTRSAGGEITSILQKMEVGDSVFVPKPANKVTGSVQYFCGLKKYSDRFKIRSVEGGSRIWRIA